MSNNKAEGSSGEATDFYKRASDAKQQEGFSINQVNETDNQLITEDRAGEIGDLTGDINHDDTVDYQAANLQQKRAFDHEEGQQVV